MVYVPGVDAARSITPVVALIVSPAGEEENVPPVAPARADDRAGNPPCISGRPRHRRTPGPAALRRPHRNAQADLLLED